MDIQYSTIDPVPNMASVFNGLCTKISWHYATMHEIEKIIKLLKTEDSSRCDEITNRILKFSAPFIILPLTYICNALLVPVFSSTD
jgi:hypothetical protein